MYFKSTYMQPRNNNAAFYLRLSKEDDKLGESESIENQRKILKLFMVGTDYLLFKEYIDDGYSGTSMDRPALNRMLADIEKGRIGIVLTKDFSRLGRNLGRVQTLLDEFFTKHRVRYIAVSEGIDTMQRNGSSSILAPVLGFTNELYAADISRKINSSFEAKMANGEFIGAFAPFGYRKDPKNKNHLIPDTASAEIVKNIFEQAKNGHSPNQISQALNFEGTKTPSLYRYEVNSHLKKSAFKSRDEWTASSVSKILRNEVYLGHTVQGKTHKPNFKSDYIISVPKESWIRVENTHIPLIDKDTWEIVRKKMHSRTKLREIGFVNIFSGIAKCADCKKNMSSTGSRKRGAAASLACGGYKLKGKAGCTNHFIDYDCLYKIVINVISRQISFTDEERKEIIGEMMEQCKNGDTDLSAEVRAKIDSVNQKLEQLFCDRYNKIIEGEQFDRLLERFNKEKACLGIKLTECERAEALKNNEEKLSEMYKKFEKLIFEYENLANLSSDILFKLIERIDIHQGYYESGTKLQQIDIYFKFKCEPDDIFFYD